MKDSTTSFFKIANMKLLVIFNNLFGFCFSAFKVHKIETNDLTRELQLIVQLIENKTERKYTNGNIVWQLSI